MRILVVGGVAAGASAATKARRTNEDAEIILFEKGAYVSFANCGLPYLIGEVIPDRDELLLVTPELFKDRFNIDVRLEHEVIDIAPQGKTITVKTKDGDVSEPYDVLILATGGTPLRPKLPGIELPGVHTVFTVPDADGLREAIDTGAKTAVVVGGGFIGLETAENLLARGLRTILVEKLPRLLSTMDEEFSFTLCEELCAAGLELHLNTGLKELTGTSHVEGVALDDGTVIPCDLVVLAMGVRPNTELAVKAGLTLGKSGGVLVDGTMKTSDPAIYAAGDMVESLHLVSGKKVRIPLAGSANKQGRVAGANAARANAVGAPMLFKGVLGTSIIKVGELTAARTGLNQEEAAAAGLAHRVLYVPGNSNAVYYPGAEQMLLKLTVQEPTGKLLGAQAIGTKGVDKRIDVLATAIYAGLTVFDLENLDLAYAPPYSSAKDPVIMAGMVAANALRGAVAYATPQELPTLLENGALLLDVRTDEEYNKNHIDGAQLLPVDELRSRYNELDITKTYVVTCAVGYRAYHACLFLQSKGYKVINLSGGMRAYSMRDCECCCKKGEKV